MQKIENPEIRIIETVPSSLGTVDFYIVIYEKSDFNDTKLLKENSQSEIAEEIYETGEYQGFYVLHSSSTRGTDIENLSQGEKSFCCNRINSDSIISYHCLAMRSDGQDLKLRTGFHEVHPEVNPSETIYDWDSLRKVSNACQEILVKEDGFFKLYEEQVKVWKKEITERLKS